VIFKLSIWFVIKNLPAKKTVTGLVYQENGEANVTKKDVAPRKAALFVRGVVVNIGPQTRHMLATTESLDGVLGEMRANVHAAQVKTTSLLIASAKDQLPVR
jgi:hypothetical protein|tara:strand:- start:571 stop:876 length:306 start_codon:yes stop_codon:yes gene_type:complete